MEQLKFEKEAEMKSRIWKRLVVSVHLKAEVTMGGAKKDMSWKRRED